MLKSDRLMAALADPENGWIVPGNVDGSRFVRELLTAPRRMSRFLIWTVPEIGDRSAREVIIGWIQDGCPLPDAGDARSARRPRPYPEPRCARRRLRPARTALPPDRRWSRTPKCSWPGP